VRYATTVFRVFLVMPGMLTGAGGQALEGIR
jgi:hypothetical protein